MTSDVNIMYKNIEMYTLDFKFYLFYISAGYTVQMFLLIFEKVYPFWMLLRSRKWRDVRRCVKDGNVIYTRNFSGNAHIIKMRASDINVAFALKGFTKELSPSDNVTWPIDVHRSMKPIVPDSFI